MFKVPKVRLGDVVYWYPGGNRQPALMFPASVVAIQFSSLHLRVSGVEGDFRIECCRHVDDPTLKDSEKIESGAWEVRAELEN